MATVSKLVGLLRFGDAVWFFSPRVAGDLERVLGEPGTDSVGLGETGLDDVVLGDPGTDSVGLGETGLENAVLGDPGIDRVFLHATDRPPQQSSSSSRSSLLCF